jgi:hypothetical protein
VADLLLAIPDKEIGAAEEGSKESPRRQRPVSAGYSRTHEQLEARVAAGLRGARHVIESVRFGRGRLTTCAACGFQATGPTDEAMAMRWNAHPIAEGLAFKAARRPSQTQ